jgi:hypothetical protein
MTPYQIFLLVILIVWPLAILGILMLMARLEERIERTPGRSPKEAGLEPARGQSPEREVKIVFGGEVVEAGSRDAAPGGAASQAVGD